MPTAQQIETALEEVIDQKTFINKLLVDALGWPIEGEIEGVEDISFGWSSAELRAEGLSEQLLGGSIRQLQPLEGNQPWGIFLLEFRNPDVFTTGRGLTGPLRKVLRGLVPKKQTGARPTNLPAWKREHLLFICTHNYQYYRFAYFKAPKEKGRIAPLTTFGWEPDTPARTACEFNLPYLEWPEDTADTNTWGKQWQHAFDKQKLTKAFFGEYKAIFDILQKDLACQTKDNAWAHDYALQFLNRCMFIYFIQKKRWINNDPGFLKTFWDAYRQNDHLEDSFFDNWLKVVFFEAFNNRFHGGHRQFSDEIKKALQLAPYLNGGLFTENDLDRKPDFTVSDERFGQIITFLERYNFTVSEDTPLDVDVAVDAEMLGMVYESLVNISEDEDRRGEAGIFYTPRVEIDMMCRLSLVDNLANHIGPEYKSLLYEWVFAYEFADKATADKAVKAAKLTKPLEQLIAQITVVDPACGSGSFLVGMLMVLDDLRERLNVLQNNSQTAYDRRRETIGRNLYGVDVMEWACHVAELRLWLALIIDVDFSPEELNSRKIRREPMLPNFSFNIRCGDSLVQEVGGINLRQRRGSSDIPKAVKDRLRKLQNAKLAFYNNQPLDKFKTVEAIKNKEITIFRDMLGARAKALEDQAKELMRQIEKAITPRYKKQKTFDGYEENLSNLPTNGDQNTEKKIEQLMIQKDRVTMIRDRVRNPGDVPFVWDIAFAEVMESDKDGFDIVIGNPPYVRQEKIADPMLSQEEITTENKKTYKAKLARAVYQEYRNFFQYKAGTDKPGHKINAKSDLYIYFYFLGLSLLNPEGSFCFITSNSWLDVGYGRDLQEFLLRHSHVKMILDNQAMRSFASADVNTVIALFSSPDDRNDHGLEEKSRFVMFKVPFEQILSPVIFEEIEEAKRRRKTKEYRIFPIKQDKLLKDGCEIKEKAEKKKTSGSLIKTAKYLGNKWGARYLRAPDIYWTVIEKYGDALTHLDRAVEVCRGVTTGCNEFFFLERTGEKTEEGFVHVTNGDGWAGALEKNTLQFGVQKVKECTKLIFEPKKLVFCPPDNPPHHAASYIRYGESMGYSRRSTCKARAKWWKLPTDKQNASLIGFNYNIYDTGRSYISSVCPTYYSDSFHVLRCSDPESLHAYMNSTLFHFLINVDARTVFGGGKAKLQTYELEDLYCIKKFTCIGKAEDFSTMYEKLCGREDKYLIDELTEPVRLAIDEVIFDILGLTQGEREAVYGAVIDLVETRLKKADSLR